MLRIYRLIPVAGPEDPNWSLSPYHGEVIVRAKTRSNARMVAAQAEADLSEKGAKPGDGVSTKPASAFRNENLYTVIEDISGRYSGEGPCAVLSGSFDARFILPFIVKGQ